MQLRLAGPRGLLIGVDQLFGQVVSVKSRPLKNVAQAEIPEVGTELFFKD